MSTATYFINAVVYQYPGNQYLPPIAWVGGANLCLLYIGLRFCFHKAHYVVLVVSHLLLIYGVYVLLALFANGIQFSPFAPIDNILITLEESLHIHLLTYMQWAHQYPKIHLLMGFIYDSLPYQVAIIPCLVSILGKFQRVQSYLCYVLLSALIGFTFYYFFPTVAPASMLHSPLFMTEQVATGLKFHHIHQGITPSTIDGGMIAMPSFHAIWALLCLYLVAEWPYVFVLLSIWNALLILSCVLLGWHYPIDILGALVTLSITYYLILAIGSRKLSSN